MTEEKKEEKQMVATGVRVRTVTCPDKPSDAQILEFNKRVEGAISQPNSQVHVIAFPAPFICHIVLIVFEGYSEENKG